MSIKVSDHSCPFLVDFSDNSGVWNVYHVSENVSDKPGRCDQALDMPFVMVERYLSACHSVARLSRRISILFPNPLLSNLMSMFGIILTCRFMKAPFAPLRLSSRMSMLFRLNPPAKNSSTKSG